MIGGTELRRLIRAAETLVAALSNEISRVRFWEARLQQRPAGQHSPSQAPLEAYWQIVRPPVRRWLDC